jgi:general L-amino acid transport system permease protein
MPPKPTPSPSTPFWRDERFYGIAAQVIFVLVVLGAGAFMVGNLGEALRKQNIPFGFDFFPSRAGFDISDTLIEYSAESNYWQALQVGLLNTLFVAVVGIVLASLMGLVLGVAQLSSNFVISRLSRAYTEIMRNVPLLVFLIFWYRGIFFNLPRISEALQLGPFLISNRGVAIPWFVDGVLSVPMVEGRAFVGGLVLSPEMAAIISGLVLYTAAFIGEVVRSGVLAIPKGQFEAARALGLNPLQSLRLVILPQALRVIIPPLTSQYLNLTKNSSLAAAVGYPELWSISTVIINQTGRAVEMISIVMAVYLTFSLLTSLLMNWYNQKVRLIER